MAKCVFVACVIAACFWSTEPVDAGRLNKKAKRYIENDVNDICTRDVTKCYDIRDIIAKQMYLETENKALQQNLSEIQTYLKKLQAVTCEVEGRHHSVYRNGRCYMISFDDATWDNAFALCREKGGYLVEINDDAELEFLQKVFLRFYKHNHFWTGATFRADRGQVLYNQSGEPVPKDYWAWKESAYMYEGNCATMQQFCDLRLYMRSCREFNPFVCEKPFNGL